MKIFIGGLNSQQQQRVQEPYLGVPDLEFIFCSSEENVKRWGEKVADADVVIALSKFNGHKQINTLKANTKLPITFANGGVSSVVKIIDDIIYGESDAINIG